MKLAGFIVALKNEVQDLVFPHCTGMEALYIGFNIGAYLVKYGQPSEQQITELAKFGVVSDDGTVNLDIAEQALLLGVRWPLKIGAFKFDENDVKKVFEHLRSK